MNKGHSSRWLRLGFVLIGLGLWLASQKLIGHRQLIAGPNEIVDLPHVWTATLHAYLQENAQAADLVLIVSSLVIDALAVFLLAWSVFGPSLRPFVGLLFLFVARQVCQVLIALPPPPEMIWRQPVFGGFSVPSLVVTYEVENDFFFSGHTALAVYGAFELARLGRWWLTVLAVVIALFECAVVIILRAHWTMDVLAGVFAAIVAGLLAAWVDPAFNHCLKACSR